MRTKDKNNLEFIIEKIERDNITAPDSLNTDNIKQLLGNDTKDQTNSKINVSNGRNLKGIVSIAACAALLLTAISTNLITGKNGPHTSNNNNQNHSNSRNLLETKETFSSYDELISTIKQLNINSNSIENYYDKKNDAAYSPSTSGSSTAQSPAQDHEDTYKQVDDVDEGDIIKNDGKYIYIADSYNSKISIFETNSGSSELISSISFEDYADNMYLYGDKLAVISSDHYDDKTSCVIYDISDKAEPQKLSSLSQDGYYLSSRAVDDQLYLITNKYADYYDSSDIKYNELIPHVFCSAEGKASDSNGALDIDDIYSVKNPIDPNYVIISSLDIGSTYEITDQKAILGAGTDVYCTTENLYVTNEEYTSDIEKTHIMKFSLKDGEIDLTAQGDVNGTAINQYSMDEKDGNLRIATTYFNQNYDECNTVFVLDEQLNVIGNSGKFAKNESIQAVRYIGNTAYVITYENTDPLFVIDLSQPTAPEVKGSVNITGFSSMLHPVDENTLIGIGYADEELANGQWIDGVKIVLFDISDSSNPKVLDSLTLKGTYSEAQYNPKAFMVNDDEGYYAIPISYELSDSNSATKTFKIENNQINITNNFEANNNFSAERCTYIGDYVYIIEFNYNQGYKLSGFKYEENGDTVTDDSISEDTSSAQAESENDSDQGIDESSSETDPAESEVLDDSAESESTAEDSSLTLSKDETIAEQ